MNSTTIPFTIQLPPDMPFAFSLQALYERLETVTDRRDPRGVRYPLPALLLIAVLARLAGYRRREPMAAWARLRAADLAALLGLPRATMPHLSTWSRVLGDAVDGEELEPVLSAFFREQQAAAEGIRRAAASSWRWMARPCAARSPPGRPVACICWRWIGPTRA
ncbi:MAG: transposase family protein [Roseiflexaceae bacterium]|nr:transposase family protein [Roseiflexaceae bacterium]